MRRRLAEPTSVPDLTAGLLPTPGKMNLVDLGLLGAHFLIRKGRTRDFVYFCPSSAAATQQDWIAPYRYDVARNGFNTRNGIRITGLSELIVRGQSDGMGSSLAIGRGVCQYVPDLFRCDVRRRIGYVDLDILTRNRSSLYLVIDEDLSLLEYQAAADPVAILIIQCAIPHFLGSTIIATQKAGQYALITDAREDASFFLEIIEDLYAANWREQVSELMRYTNMLSQVVDLSVTIRGEVRGTESHRVIHAQKGVWLTARSSYKAAQDKIASAEPSSPFLREMRAGLLLIDYLSFVTELGKEDLTGLRLAGVTNLAEALDLLAHIFKVGLFLDKYLAGLYRDPLPALCDDCARARPIAKLVVGESAVLVILIEFLRNAGKHGRPAGSPPNSKIKPVLVYGCAHKLLRRPGTLVITRDRNGGALRLEPIPQLPAVYQRGLFVATGDYSDLPVPTEFRAERDADRGLPQCLRLCDEFRPSSAGRRGRGTAEPPLIGFAPLADASDIPGRKLTFCLFPESLIMS